ncbi:YegS/Rv2252/BmrU family lipid kinase [Gordonia desulfuricans]|uniref:YegS/Rv2252/BmrU family lipid kinase n=1 Tax=Gordonia desulfuricans TaxID=89051 RepID=A0A7K3LW86_9ACTN|nr:YegS/Rv2252/BmrU family lipid kinase [Gordonia sp. NB41Y]NDK92545.1 YegS/Rv2252/BmrU family lipid kinase [Gordonia desulfuricans]WLP88551.1 YegS/Rv2252/BmrU family lipid kinase [Gordonia sp. NB41Y]
MTVSTTPVDHVTVIANPHSRQGAGRRIAHRAVGALRSLGVGHELVLTADAAHVLEAAGTAARGGTGALAACGGDGTLRLVLEGSFGSGTPIGVIPAGHGNDLARHLDIPIDDPDAAVAVIVAGHRRTVDLGRVTFPDGTSSLFASVAATGFDALVAAKSLRMSWPRGQFRFPIATLRSMNVLDSRHYYVRVDEEHSEHDLMFATIGNANSYGAGMRVTPDASMEDGMLDVTLAGPPRRFARLTMARNLPRMYSGRHIEHSRVTTLRGREVELYCDPPAPVSVDGDVVGHLPAVFEIVPAAVEMLTHPDD